MLCKTIVASLLASTVLCAAASAQQTPTPNQPAATTAPRTPAAMKHSGEWRASKMIGVRVYNQQNERIGDINEILLDQSGKAVGFIIGVGGFLGMGEHDVLLKSEQVKFVNEPLRTSANPPASTTGAATRNQDATARPARAADEKWYPDHAVVNATKDQLKAMPQFSYASYN